MALRIGDEAPNFQCKSALGGKVIDTDWHTYIEGSWAILCSHPKDFTPVCTTEVGTVAKMSETWAERNAKVAVVSVDSAEEHVEWVKEIERSQECTVDYPLLGDEKKVIAQLYGMLDQTHLDAAGLPLTVRSVFVIGPDKKIKLIITYPASCGRNFDEVVRVLDSLQLTAYQKCATPANWAQGSKVCLLPTMSDEEANTYAGMEVQSASCKLRLVPQPKKLDGPQ
jgi:alkyl hydroperoxide reductase subunit AhpC